MVGLRRFLGGNVLVEGASEGYVDQLLSAADAQDGYSARCRCPDQIQVVAVAQGIDGAQLGVGGFSVDGRVEVLASGQDEGVDAVQHAGEGGGVLGDGEQERRASGLDDGLAVFAADAGVVVGHGAGDADDGTVVCGWFLG